MPMHVSFSYPMNRQVRMLDGQWQGLHLASDGCAYFFGGSHCAGVGAPFFRYDPRRGEVELLALDMSRVCGEDPARVPTQGKVHSDILEHQGWLYFGTHLSDYTVAGCEAYTGGHLVGYELATGRFRDYGVIHANYTNYSAIGLDAIRHRIYFYATPFGRGDGPHLHRVDLATGANLDLGLVTPWGGKNAKGQGHGQPCQHLFIDPAGDCWFTLRDEHALFVARSDSGRIERYDGALPGNAPQWYCQRTLSPDVVLVILPDGLYHFDSRRFGGPRSPFTRWREIMTPGLTWAYLAVDGQRCYWNSRSQEPLPATGRHETRVWSVALADPSALVDHGPITDDEGRSPWFVGDLASDGRGRLYTVGRWYVRPDEVPTIGVDRHGLMVAAFFAVLDLGAEATGCR